MTGYNECNADYSPSPEQESIINELQKNLFIWSPAGTGKTNALSYRIYNVLEKGLASNNEILCITFTNKACREMKERLKVVLDTDTDEIAVKTIHSFCYDIIKTEAKKKTDIFKDFTVYDNDECESVLNEVPECKGYNLKKISEFIYELKHFKAENELKNNMQRQNFSQEFLENLIEIFSKDKKKKFEDICITSDYKPDFKLKTHLLKNGAKIICDYNSLLSENHALDFVDLIVNTHCLFESKDIVLSWRRRYKFINIDEIQDTSWLEYSILRRLFKDNNVLLCGDLNQTIYEWRGSEPNQIYSDFERIAQPEFKRFTINYRSTKKLLAVSNNLVKNMLPGNDIECFPYEKMDEGRKPNYYLADSIHNEAYYMYSEIKKLDTKDIPSICILARTNNYTIALSTELKRIRDNDSNKTFDFMLVEEFHFFKREKIKDIFSFLKICLNKYDSQSCRRIIKKFVRGAGAVTLKEIESEAYYRTGLRVSDFLDYDALKYSDPFSLLIDNYSKNNVVVFDVETTGINTTTDEIIQIAAIKISSSGEIVDKFERFLKTSKILDESSKIHGFTNDFIDKHGEDSKKILREFIRFAKGAALVGHNVQYDLSILESQILRVGLEDFEYTGYFDTLDIYRRYYPNLENHKLAFLSEYFKINSTPNHNAYNDILATKELLVLSLKHKIIPERADRCRYISKYQGVFMEISEFLRNLRLKSYHETPVKLIECAMEKNFHMKQFTEGQCMHINTLVDIANEMFDNNLSHRDNLTELVKMSSLSNSELDLVARKRYKIPIITVHQAKGLEFDYVFISGLMKDIFPLFPSVKNGFMNEEKRLFYVGVTRAKKMLHLTASKTYIGKSKSASELINYVDNLNIIK